jgi:1,4-alpha-glucan branching enzyme
LDRLQAGAADGDTYRFWVVGAGGSGYKRDPYARELSPKGFPNCFSILRAVNAYPWHDAAFRTPDFSDMPVYQLHIGSYAISQPGIASNFLDVAGKVPYLAALGANVLQPLPVDEQEANPSMGYGGAGRFAPDFPYVAAAVDLPAYLVGLRAGLFPFPAGGRKSSTATSMTIGSIRGWRATAAASRPKAARCTASSLRPRS